MVDRPAESKADRSLGAIKKPPSHKLGTRLNPSQDPMSPGFPTLVLSRSGCEGRPINRTLSLKAPLAMATIVFFRSTEVNRLLGPFHVFSFGLVTRAFPRWTIR